MTQYQNPKRAQEINMPRSVDLGFLEECDEPWLLESRLFPSKVGGKPAWLSLEDLPKPEDLQCPNCTQQMVFLCQIYAPINLEGNFHSTIFVFVCRNGECSKRNDNSNFKVFRNNLPRYNKFYSSEPPEEAPDPSFSIEKFVNLCALCGCYASKACGQCKVPYYCCQKHQVIDWKNGHREKCFKPVTTKSKKPIPTGLFSEWELVIEKEKLPDVSKVDEQEELNKLNDLHLNVEPELISVDEAELEDHATKETDKVFSKFKKRIEHNPEQVIRYDIGGTPLWIASSPKPKKVPDCLYCNSKRQFEFQIMPQMLALLKETELDWGVIAVYTCSKHCTGGPTYKEEFIFRQDVTLSDVS